MKAESGNNNQLIFRRRLLIMFLLSLIAHILIPGFILYKKNLFILPMVRPQLDEAEKRLEFELVDVPDQAAPLDREVDTPYISDRSARASDPFQAEKIPEGEAMAKGLDVDSTSVQARNPGTRLEVAERKKSPESKQLPRREEKPLQPSEKTDEQTVENLQEFMDSTFSSRYATESMPQARSPRELLRRNMDSRAPDDGGISLNTYAWEFAPYLKEVKRKIEQNLTTPMAFNQLGMIEGATLIRFRIYRDGHVEGLEVLKTVGHAALMRSSVNSIMAAQPFKQLPPDFPASYEYLEITANYKFVTH